MRSVFLRAVALGLGLVSGAAAASAEMQPHRATYTLRLGAAANAPRVGTAVQDLTLACDGWHLAREIQGEIALTPSLKMNVVSRLDGAEPGGGEPFRFRTVQSQNGAERAASGRVRRDGGSLRAEIDSGAGAGEAARRLPADTLMPAAWLARTVGELRRGQDSFDGFLFDAEGTRDAFAVDVSLAPAKAVRARRPADRPVAVPADSWPVAMSFTRGDAADARPLFTLTGQLFDNGVLDRLTIDAGALVVTADLQSLELHPRPTCAP